MSLDVFSRKLLLEIDQVTTEKETRATDTKTSGVVTKRQATNSTRIRYSADRVSRFEMYPLAPFLVRAFN